MPECFSSTVVVMRSFEMVFEVPRRISYKTNAAVDYAPNFASRWMSNFSFLRHAGICIAATGRVKLSLAQQRGF